MTIVVFPNSYRFLGFFLGTILERLMARALATFAFVDPTAIRILATILTVEIPADFA